VIKKAFVALGGTAAARPDRVRRRIIERSGDPNTLNVYAWAGEIPDSVVQAFTKETGIKVQMDTFDSNETMIAKLAAGNSGYDLVEPSQYAVQQLVGQNLIEELDHSRIQGLENLSKKFADPSYDPGNKHSVPWVWGTTGLIYNAKCTGKPVDSCKRSSTLPTRQVCTCSTTCSPHTSSACRFLGFKADSTDQSQIEAATNKLQEQKPLLGRVQLDQLRRPRLSGSGLCLRGLGWRVDGEGGRDQPGRPLRDPEGGGTLWTDGLSIAKGASHSDAAYKFISFTLRPEIAALATDDGSMASRERTRPGEDHQQEPARQPRGVRLDREPRECRLRRRPGKAMAYFHRVGRRSSRRDRGG